MDTKLPGLVVELEAKITKLERGLARANDVQRRSADQMERRAKQSADHIENSYAAMTSKVSGAFSKLSIPVAVAASAAATAKGLANVARGIADIGREAARSGVSVRAFQEWSFLADQNRIPIDSLIDGFKELNLRADEFIITKAGPAADAFKRIGFDAKGLERALKDPSELMLTIMKRMEGLDRAAQIRVADELFGGTAGERFVELLAQGEDQLRATIQRAHEVGAVLSDEVVAKATDVDRKFKEITTTIANMGKSLVVNVASAIEDVLTIDVDEIFGSAERAISMMGEENYRSMKAGADVSKEHVRTAEELVATYDELFRAISVATGPTGARLMDVADLDEAHEFAAILTDIDREMVAFQNGATSAGEFEEAVGDLIGEAEDLIAELGSVDAQRFGNVISAIGGIASALANAAAQASALRQSMPAGEEAPLSVGPTSRRGHREGTPPRSSARPVARPATTIDFVYDTGRGGGGGRSRAGGGGSKSADEFANTVDKLKEEIAALELEATALVATAAAGEVYAGAVEKARTEAELLAAAQKEGREITPALRAEIAALADGYTTAARSADDAADRIEAITDAQERVKGIAGDAFSGLVLGTMSWRDALRQVLLQLAELAVSNLWTKLAQNATLASGTGGGGTGFLSFLGSLLGFADGGYTGHGGKYEPAGVVHKGEFVLSKRAVENIGVPALEALHSHALRGYAGGGLVGDIAKPMLRDISSDRSRTPTIAINAPVTVNASGGTPEQNTDLARQISREMEESMRQVVVKEIRSAMRPGNMLNCGT